MFKLLNRNIINVIYVYGFSMETSVSLKNIGRILSAISRGQGKTTFNLYVFSVQLKNNSSNFSHFAPLNRDDTDPQKTLNALEVKLQTG